MNINESDKKITILCHFCGSQNQFQKQDMYEENVQKPIFKEKYCLTCGEPLIFECPSCSTRFRLDINFSKNSPLIELPGFWEPTYSPLDLHIPKLLHLLETYKNYADESTIRDYRGNQKEFLSNLPNLSIQLTEINDLLNKVEISEDNTEIIKIKKLIKNNIATINSEIDDINTNIDSESGLVDIKKEKKMIKKGLPFNSIIDIVEKFLGLLQSYRDEEIQNEKNMLKPGHEKFIRYFKQNPDFYKIYCPTCAIGIFSLNHQIVIKNKMEKNLQFLKNSGQFYDQSTDSENISTKTIKFKVEIQITTQKEYIFNGLMPLVIEEGHPLVFGRNLIREIEYQGNTDEEVLFNEDDPLKRVSNSQITLKLKNGRIFIQPMEYDEHRVGTYLNNLNQDIRLQNPDGMFLTSGDVIIIPLIKDSNNKNQIKLKFLD